MGDGKRELLVGPKRGNCERLTRVFLKSSRVQITLRIRFLQKKGGKKESQQTPQKKDFEGRSEIGGRVLSH